MDLFDVSIVRFSEHAKEPPEDALRRVFGMDDARAARVTANLPCVVKRGVPLEVALKFVHALASIGAEVTLGAHRTVSTPPQGRYDSHPVSLPPPPQAERDLGPDAQEHSGLELDLRGGTGRRSSAFPAAKTHSSTPPARGVAMASYIPPAPTPSTHPSMRTGHTYASRRPPAKVEAPRERPNYALWLTLLVVVVVAGVALRALRG